MLDRTEQNSRAAQQELRSFRDRIVRLEEQKKEIAEDIKEVFAEAKGRGYDTKALRQVVKREMETASEAEKRRETEAITELYLANLGMLDGTPLGDAARERVVEAEAQDKGDDDAPPAGDGAPVAPTRGVFTEQEIDEARSRGANDSREGKRIIDNPFMAGDPRRAAWDEGHCQDRGSDGMDIPDSWRRKVKDKAAPEKGAQS
jgi:uncharacterized protein (UPF0335 family)